MGVTLILQGTSRKKLNFETETVDTLRALAHIPEG